MEEGFQLAQSPKRAVPSAAIILQKGIQDTPPGGDWQSLRMLFCLLLPFPILVKGGRVWSRDSGFEHLGLAS